MRKCVRIPQLSTHNLRIRCSSDGQLQTATGTTMHRVKHGPPIGNGSIESGASLYVAVHALPSDQVVIFQANPCSDLDRQSERPILCSLLTQPLTKASRCFGPASRPARLMRISSPAVTFASPTSPPRQRISKAGFVDCSAATRDLLWSPRLPVAECAVPRGIRCIPR